MADGLLLPVTFQPSAPVRNLDKFRVTVIENAPQVSIRQAPPHGLQPRASFASPLSEDFPTPRAMSSITEASIENSSVSGSSDSESDQSSLWSKRSSRSDFDEMYDLSSSENEEFPIRLSHSVKRRVAKRDTKPRFPSIVIPSPSQWPTLEKLKSATTLSPPLQVTLSPRVLSRLREQSLRVPSTTPSLDGSQTSEEQALSSCPSTPDLRSAVDDNDGHLWEAPIQLDPSAINLLQHINADEHHEQNETVIEVSAEHVSEMQEVLTPPTAGCFKLNTVNLAPADPSEADDELSALSVPSPGGFFASLDTSLARKAWAGVGPTPTTSVATEFYGVPFKASEPTDLATSTATSFYNVPWQTRPDNTVEHIVTIPSPPASQDVITARKIVFSPGEIIPEVDEIDEKYSDNLRETAAANIDRTQLWLSAQTDYMRTICEEDSVLESFVNIDDAVPKTPDQVSPSEGLPRSTESTPSKKSVRFAATTEEEDKTESADAGAKRVSPIHDGTFWEGWRHQKRSQRARDVFLHRQARAEAEQVKRTSLPTQHADQLKGKYEVTSTERPAAPRPISSMLPETPEDEIKQIIAKAERERQALQQMESSAWHLAAQKEVNGGKLLMSPVVQTFKGRKDVAILDLAGQAHCGWAWSVAHDHPDAAVYTTVSSDAEAHVAQLSLEGPANHTVVASPFLWELPFADNFFDVISARNLYAHLKTTRPMGQVSDEWDLTLRECMRVLKPGGYLEFDLLDAELVHAESSSQAAGVEFAFNLKTMGYDPWSGKSFLPRLKRAGFGNIKRAWMVLPAADSLPRWHDAGKTAAAVERTITVDGTVTQLSPPITGSTKDVRAMTGLVGARMWEQWMLKLNGEMGRNETRCLDGIAKALEQAGKGNAAWRCLVGWARKDI